MPVYSVVVAGVGGQGILLASEILGNAAMKEGFDVRVSEIHGMAQRGGSVVCFVRFGKKVWSHYIPEGQADVLLGIEPVEALRYIDKASKERTVTILNSSPVYPPGVSLGKHKYPPIYAILEQARKRSKDVFILNALDLAKEAGSPLTQNVVMLGALAASKALPIKPDTLKKAIKELVKPRYVDVNMKAFDLGYSAIERELLLGKLEF